MKKIRFLSCILSLLVMVGLLCGCNLLQRWEDHKAEDRTEQMQNEDNLFDDSIISDGEAFKDTESNDSQNTEETEPETTIYVEPPVEQSILDTSYSLTPVATFEKVKDLSFTRDIPLVREYRDGDKFDYLYSYTGKLMIQEPCNEFSYYGDGFAAMYLYNGSTPSARLVNINTGEVYLDDPSIAQIRQINERYYSAVFVEKQVSETEDYFIKFHARRTGDMTAFYSGHGKVYDIQNRKFVDDLMVSDPALLSGTRAVGSNLFVNKAFNLYDAYIPTGNKTTIIEDINITRFTKTGYVCEDKGNCFVYDADCTLLTKLEDTYAQSDYAYGGYGALASDKYFLARDGQNYRVTDINGKEILNGSYSYAFCVGDYIIPSNDQDKYALYFATGEQILPFSYDSFKICENDGDSNKIMMEFSCGESGEEKYVYVPGCSLLNVTGYNGLGLVYYKDGEDNTRDYFVLSTGETITTKKYLYTLGTTLVSCDKGLIDMTDGSFLMEPGYDYMSVTKEYVYIFQDGQWNVYRLDLTTK